MNRAGPAALLFLVLSACEPALECGAGSHQVSDECVSSLHPLCGPGTQLLEGSCIPAEGGGDLPCGVGTHAQDDMCLPDVKSSPNAGRFYEVLFTYPEPLALANDVVAEDFRSGKSLVFMGAYAPTPNVLRLFGGGGARTNEDDLSDNTFSLAGDLAFDTNTKSLGEDFTTEPFVLKIPLVADKPFILLSTVISNGKTDRIGDALHPVRVIRSGALSGVMTRTNADDLYIEIVNQTFAELLLGFNVQPDLDYEEPKDGTKESWTISLTFVTEDVQLILP